MDFTDFIIGLSLMHAMPHLILGLWNRRMYSPFGYGKYPNIFYSFFVIGFSLCLFFMKYGIEELPYEGVYVGAITALIGYAFFGRLLYKKIQKSKYR